MHDRSTTSVAADLDRRGFLRGALALPLLGSSARAFAEDAPSHPGLILREAQPEQAPTPEQAPATEGQPLPEDAAPAD